MTLKSYVEPTPSVRHAPRRRYRAGAGACERRTGVMVAVSLALLTALVLTAPPAVAQQLKILDCSANNDDVKGAVLDKLEGALGYGTSGGGPNANRMPQEEKDKLLYAVFYSGAEFFGLEEAGGTQTGPIICVFKNYPPEMVFAPPIPGVDIVEMGTSSRVRIYDPAVTMGDPPPLSGDVVHCEAFGATEECLQMMK